MITTNINDKNVILYGNHMQEITYTKKNIFQLTIFQKNHRFFFKDDIRSSL